MKRGGSGDVTAVTSMRAEVDGGSCQCPVKSTGWCTAAMELAGWCQQIQVAPEQLAWMQGGGLR